MVRKHDSENGLSSLTRGRLKEGQVYWAALGYHYKLPHLVLAQPAKH